MTTRWQSKKKTIISVILPLPSSLCSVRMHRSFQPITPATNKLLKQRWEETYFEEHRRKVASAKPKVDSRPPRTYMHLHLKLKKLQVEEERLATVERDNRILLEKMSQIMRTKGRVDNWNNYHAKSLNRTKRQQELLRVTHENQAILKRVLAQEPVYSHQKWEDDWLEKEAHMDSISKYPKEWYKKSVSKKISPVKSEANHQDAAKKSPKKDTKPVHEEEDEEVAVKEYEEEKSAKDEIVEEQAIEKIDEEE